MDFIVNTIDCHPKYLEKFIQTYNVIFQRDGPLSYEYRCIIAIMAAGRHQCCCLMNYFKYEFLDNNGEPSWLLGLKSIPLKLQKLYRINKLLAHRPWLLEKSHIEYLVKGKDNWLLSELAHAMILLVHFHSLTSFIFACGVNTNNREEHDCEDIARKAIKTPLHQEVSGANINLVTEHCYTVNTHGIAGRSISEFTSNAIRNVVDENPIIAKNVPTRLNNNEGQKRLTGGIRNNLLPNPHSSSVKAPLSPSVASIFGEQELKIEMIVARMRELATESETDSVTQQELKERYEIVERQSTQLKLAPERSSPVTEMDIGVFIEDPTFIYTDFSRRGEQKSARTFRYQEFTWADHACSLVNSLYNDVGNLLDEKFKTAYNLTYNNMGQFKPVDTKTFRRAIWNYIHCLYGIRHDDYDYNQVNQLLVRSLKTLVKNAVCYPERVTWKHYDSVMAEFEDSEKVHLNVIIMEARVQAELLYGLRTIMDYMTYKEET